jgi:NTP pyrophosphatase (non-canonical NTP hydrolase)
MDKKPMTLNEYQEKAMSTCMPSCDNMAYMLLNLVAEVGELAGKVAKPIRREEACFRDNLLTPAHLWEEDDMMAFQDMVQEMAYEAGDVLWQLSGVVKRLGFTLEEVAQLNLDKLASRRERGKIDGNGDHR